MLEKYFNKIIFIWIVILSIILIKKNNKEKFTTPVTLTQNNLKDINDLALVLNKINGANNEIEVQNLKINGTLTFEGAKDNFILDGKKYNDICDARA